MNERETERAMVTLPETELVQSTLILGAVVEARDPYTGGHMWRVAQIGKLIGQHMGMTRYELFKLTLGGFIHDLGKVGIPDDILRKNGPLTDEELDTMKTHPLIGADLMETHPLASAVLDIIRHHHERWDGTGYPDGLKGNEITPSAAIINVADVFDALTSSRSYRGGLSAEEAMQIIEEGKGTHHRIEVVDTLQDLWRAGQLAHIAGHSSSTRTLVECLGCGPIIVLPENVEDGALVDCPSCHGRYKISLHGDTIRLAPTGEHAAPKEARVQGDSCGITEIANDISELAAT